MDTVWKTASLIFDTLNVWQGDPVAKLGLLVAVLSLIAAIVGIYYARVPTRQSARVEQQQQERFGFTYIDREECEFALQYYVEPDCSSVDPSGEDDLRALIPSRQPVYRFMDNALSLGSKYKHIIVLAETGMGKTSLLYNLLSRNAKLSSGKRRRFLYIPLGRPDVLEKISSVESKNETILLLDAFDEDTEAVRDHRQRMVSLMVAASEFKRVIVTCRTQFFTRDEEIPKESGVVKVAPREAGDPGLYLLYKIYLAPFDAVQIRKWTRKRFGAFRLLAQHRARVLIKRIPELAVRPFLLTTLPDLIKDRERVENIFELYGYMVKKWLAREERWIQPSILEEFSRRVAVDIYSNRQRRKAERLPFEELERHFAVSVPEDGWKFKSRSLLNRDSEGNFKFAHRSIMEFVFVDAYLRGDKRCLDVSWTDFMVELFWKAVESSLSGRGQLSALRESIFLDEDLRVSGILKEGVRLGALKQWASDVDVAKLGRSDQYAGLFVRVGVVRETLAICDLLKNRVYLILIGDSDTESNVFAVGAKEAESLAATWGSGGYFGIGSWRMAVDTELARLFRFQAIRKRFKPHGIRLWARLEGGEGMGMLSIDVSSGKDEVIPAATWRERLRSDPLLRKDEARAVMVLAADVDAEAFYFSRMRRLQ